MKSLLVLCAAVAALAAAASAQSTQSFATRLSPVPITVDMQATVAGSGNVTATLNGRRLTIDGKFEGLRSPATVARLHLAPPARRGDAFADLKVTSGTSGTITGAVDLTPDQVQALTRRSIYVQLHSEKAPEGNLWGWLMPQEIKR
jgi:hypothetical protein